MATPWKMIDRYRLRVLQLRLRVWLQLRWSSQLDGRELPGARRRQDRRGLLR